MLCMSYVNALHGFGRRWDHLVVSGVPRAYCQGATIEYLRSDFLDDPRHCSYPWVHSGVFSASDSISVGLPESKNPHALLS